MTPGSVYGAWTYEQLGWKVKWDEENDRAVAF